MSTASAPVERGVIPLLAALSLEGALELEK
jgi:hypothetical protein